jgi:preprotein translocase subunit Sec61beta
MAQDNKIQMPGAFGGLMRYDAEYVSNVMLSPTAVVIFLAVVVAFVLVLKIFFPVSFLSLSFLENAFGLNGIAKVVSGISGRI